MEQETTFMILVALVIILSELYKIYVKGESKRDHILECLKLLLFCLFYLLTDSFFLSFLSDKLHNELILFAIMFVIYISLKKLMLKLK